MNCGGYLLITKSSSDINSLAIHTSCYRCCDGLCCHFYSLQLSLPNPFPHTKAQTQAEIEPPSISSLATDSNPSLHCLMYYTPDCRPPSAQHTLLCSSLNLILFESRQNDYKLIIRLWVFEYFRKLSAIVLQQFADYEAAKGWKRDDMEGCAMNGFGIECC